MNINIKPNLIHVKLFFLLIISLALSSCGFYLRGSNTATNLSNSEIEFVQTINFSNQLHSAFRKRAQGVEGLTVGKTLANNIPKTKTRKVQIVDQEIITNEKILDSTTYNKESRIILLVKYKINDSAVITIERRSLINFSEADRLSAEIKIQDAIDALFNEVALSILQSILR